MKVLVLGNKSYICNRFVEYSKKYNYDIETLSVREDSWKSFNFSKYDSILCPIGIAHVSTDPSMEKLYYSINRDLPVAIAEKAKVDGAKQFIFFSSMIVYGKDLSLGQQFVINEKTELNPENFYGKSKQQAEELLTQLEDDDFKVARVRIPMVYGPDCKGNFPKLLQIAKKMPICPNIDNQRSMIYIDNLCEFFCSIIESGNGGIYHPQNVDYVSTREVIHVAAKYFNHSITFTKAFNPFIYFLSRKVGIINRIFGTKIYDKTLSPDMEKYNIVNFSDSIKYCVESYLNEKK